MKAKLPTERQEQECVIDWICKVQPWLRNHTIFIMNEKKCSKFVGDKLNKQGRLVGCSDLFFAWPTSSYCGLFIEMKSIIGKPTPAQLVFIDRMNRVGYYACVARGADEAIAVITDYLGNKL